MYGKHRILSDMKRISQRRDTRVEIRLTVKEHTRILKHLKPWETLSSYLRRLIEMDLGSVKE